MPKTRINKFIFQDGQVFLRLKTTATNLIIKRDGDNYSIQFSSQLSENTKIDIPVEFMETLPDLPDQNSDSTPHEWGKLIKEKNTGDDSHFVYYLVPEQFDFAVKIGPLAEETIASDLEIDWPNIQWGTGEKKDPE